MQNIINEFEAFMVKHGQRYDQFYVGIATDPEDRLISGHNVTVDVPNIYWNTALDTDIIRAIEKYFLNQGCQGAPGGGDEDTNYIYAYFITNNTIE
jgi:hypothetical protein